MSTNKYMITKANKGWKCGGCCAKCNGSSVKGRVGCSTTKTLLRLEVVRVWKKDFNACSCCHTNPQKQNIFFFLCIHTALLDTQISISSSPKFQKRFNLTFWANRVTCVRCTAKCELLYDFMKHHYLM